MEHFGRTSADVVLDCVGTAYADANCRVLTEGGRWVVYGVMSGAKVEDVPILAQVHLSVITLL